MEKLILSSATTPVDAYIVKTKLARNTEYYPNTQSVKIFIKPTTGLAFLYKLKLAAKILLSPTKVISFIPSLNQMNLLKEMSIRYVDEAKMKDVFRSHPWPMKGNGFTRYPNETILFLQDLDSYGIVRLRYSTNDILIIELCPGRISLKERLKSAIDIILHNEVSNFKFSLDPYSIRTLYYFMREEKIPRYSVHYINNTFEEEESSEGTWDEYESTEEE